MENKKANWQIKYEQYKNGNLDDKLKELKQKLDNKEIDAKQYYKEEKGIEKIKGNIDKIGNLDELKNELDELKSMIEDELVGRYNEKELESQLQESDKENEELLNEYESLKQQLKDPYLLDDDKKEIHKKIDENSRKLETNREKYSKLNEKRNNNVSKGKSDFSKLTEDELKKYHKSLSMKISRTNFYGNRLIKGQNIESIKGQEEAIDWEKGKRDVDVKKLVAKGKNADKMKKLSEVAKEEASINKGIREELDKIMSERKNDEHEEISESIEKENIDEFAQKHPNLAKIRDFFKGNSKNNVEKEETAMVEVDEFAQKHPKLAKIRDFFKLDKSKSNIQDKEENNIEEKQEESKEEKKEEIVIPKTETEKRKDFAKSLRDMDKYEVFDVAEKGMDSIKEERMNATREKLDANKKKAEEERAQKDAR